jgi:hypothetical protein
MNEITEKYLARMLEGAEQGLSQLDMAVEQINGQLENMADQREEMEEAVRELKELLGLDEEATQPELLVEDGSDEE